MYKFLLMTVIMLILNSVQAKGIGTIFSAAKLSGSGISAVNGIKHYNSNVMSPESLKACMIQEKTISEKQKQIEALGREIDTKNTAMQSEAKKIQFLQSEAMYQDDQGKIDRYNSAVKQYNKKAKAFKKEISEYNLLSDSFNSEITGFNHKCSMKTYYLDDYSEIEKELNK